MSNYRKAFYFALIGNVILIGVLGGLWWSNRRSASTHRSAASVPNAATEPARENQPNSVAATTETPLAPVQLSAERLQSIGVKFGVVDRRPVQDEIRATGNVAVDE